MRLGLLVLGGGLLAVGLVALVIAGRSALEPPSLQSIRGVLLEVRSNSIVHAEQITLRADDGRVVAFQVDPEVAANRDEPQSASHLRQHMAFGDPLLVRYRETPTGPVAVRVLDATEPVPAERP